MPHALRRLPLRAVLFALPVPALAQQAPVPVTCPTAATTDGDGQKDFDWEIGSWTTRLKRLKSPLSGSTTWVEYEGTTEVRPVLDGRANLVELKVAGPAGRIEGASLRLYNPKARQWALHFTGAGTGVLTPATIGAFHGGCGEFYAQDNWNDRAILVRFVISDITANSARFEQAFSADGGKSWEVNWIATDTRRN
ncbi:hypothetical protein HZY97_06860 [Sphingomonas sp. R-74633]|uniref:hypothetical protein n=1 Tax=Sphingomonas sp. R-74633 TaxID=2751188 RepID=UPI0015D2543F|nr:hypothetical protein [Sphingomonas sp. R-74633]NYT40470.1 hypothetical protein [Sphingomonas sp. R-74633]